jgi:hypothetical protein
MKNFIFILLLSYSLTLLAQESRNIEIIPADIDYSNELAEEYSQELYDMFIDSVANYNFKQTDKNKIYFLKENTLPKKKYAKRVKYFNKEIAKDPLTYIQRRDLKYLIVFDFSTKRIVRMLKRCKGKCKTNIIINYYNLNAKKLKQNMTLVYNAKVSLITRRSQKKLEKNIYKLLDNNISFVK